MRPMSLFESGLSTGEVSLRALFDGEDCSVPMPQVELGGRAAEDAAAKSLKRLSDRVDPEVTGPPRRLVVITSGGYAYERTDGVCVVPITALGP